MVTGETFQVIVSRPGRGTGGKLHYHGSMPSLMGAKRLGDSLEGLPVRSKHDGRSFPWTRAILRPVDSA